MPQVEDVTTAWKGTTASVSIDGDTDVRKFHVTFDDNAESNKRAALLAAGIPHLRDTHPTNHYITALHKHAAVKSPSLIEVTVNYGRRTTADEGTPPLSRPVVIGYSDLNESLPVDLDADGNPVVNSSNEAFDPPPTTNSSDKRMLITRNVAEYSPNDYLAIKNKVNSDIWNGFGEGIAKYHGENATQTFEEIYEFWVVVHEIHLRVGGWKLKLLDQGYREKAALDAEGKQTYTVITGDDGSTPLSQPTLLDGLGKKLAAGAPPVSLEFKMNAYEAFGPLNML